MSLPSFSVRNPVFANLLLVLIMVVGGICAVTINREMLPDIQTGAIAISTPYPGASPLEVEQGICAKIEDKVRDIAGVETVLSTAREGAAVIVLKLESRAGDLRAIQDEAKTRIDQIDDFPDEVEASVISKIEPFLPVISIALYSERDGQKGAEHTQRTERVMRRLKGAAERLKDQLLALPGISRVELGGARESEIVVEIRPRALLRWNTTFDEVVAAIRATNLNLPGGNLTSSGEEILLRTVGETRRPEQIERIIVRAGPEGRKLRLGELATVRAGFKEISYWGRYNGRPAIDVTVYKRANEDAITIADTVRAYMEQTFRPTLPPNVTDGEHNDLSKYIRQRLDLMIRNGRTGLILVFLSLTFFLSLRLSFWVAVGLPVSFLGAFIVMALAGITVNMVSLFSLIIVLGMIVDDAIIVGENCYRHMEEGLPPRLAAVRGTEEVIWPVVVAIVTTMVAFMPLLMVEGIMGDFMWALPIVVTAALAFSLLEALLILPSHLAEWLPKPARASEGETAGWATRMRERVLKRALYPGYRKTLRLAVEWRYVTMALMSGVLIVVFAAAGKRLPLVLIHSIDADSLILMAETPVGTPAAQTEAALQQIERKLEELRVERGEIKSYYTAVGLQFEIGAAGAMQFDIGGHRGQIIIELAEPDNRKRTSDEIMAELRAFAATVPDLAHSSVMALSGGPGGDDIEIEVAGEDMGPLRSAVAKIRARLAAFEGVSQVEDTDRAGKQELRLRLNPAGRAAGLTVADLARQVRAAYYGVKAGVVQQGRESVDIMARFPQEDRSRLAVFEALRIHTPRGGRVPLTEVASYSTGRGLEKITRTDGRRTITITAEVNEDVGSTAGMILDEIAREFADIGLRFPGVSLRFKGAAREMRTSMQSLFVLFPISLLIIYLILATLFRSYLQPLVVMVAIPFGFIGVIIGHFILGISPGLLSMIGMVALSGIVVNDSLILVDFINRRIEKTDDTIGAIIESGVLRLRPIILTSVTTILGLAPIMGETSFQARFLLGMAISITFGLAFATVLILIIVPCLYMILIDVQRALYRLWYGEPAPRGWTPRRAEALRRADEDAEHEDFLARERTTKYGEQE